jgi:hypothetical protein
MTEQEYNEREKRIAERDRIRSMAADLQKSRKECFMARNEESKRARIRGEKPFCGSAEGAMKIKTSGGSFLREKIQYTG